MWDSFGSTGPCSVLGMSGSYSVIAAAAINAAMGEIYLSEDMHNPTSSHPGMLVIPVAMAYGESVGASGKRVIEAIVAGYEAMGRIGAALLGPDFANNGRGRQHYCSLRRRRGGHEGSGGFGGPDRKGYDDRR